MPARRILTLGTISLLVPLALLSTPSAGSADDTGEPVVPSESAHSAHGQRIRVQALPQIVQQGREVAGPDDASTAVVATIKPVRPGRRVWLQVQHGDTWASVARTRQDRRGRAEFAAAARVDGRAATYRVRAFAAGRLPALTSDPVSTARWLDATFTDEFSGTELRPVWNHRGRDYAHGSRRSCTKGDPRAVRVGGGALRLSVLEDPDATKRCRVKGRDAVPGRFAYRLNGHVGTEGEFSFRYGVAAARVKFQRLRGQHGAFWLQAPGGVYPGATGTEIDVVEYFGDHHPQGGLATFMHRYEGRRKVTTGGWIPEQASYLANRQDGWSKGYHVFSVEWTPRLLVFRIDGRETGRMRQGVSAVRQFPILSLIAANYEIPKIKEKRLPQHMYVDWVRVWETGT
ncbi:beta-glucanase (GH16 family) [Nocardioides sp. BE266]|uniref:glycoside hydrolase family 16 protein n=1 Tax=Nocardioides sp. BE266 TaxID=2817725 RepID=UPI00285BCB93|nr:glycoside hydrolase family 16 protein [Nocardioides sp. BE266]MDR7255141.1 beta-glucanase (GH16 family) [Nocardioides sp. BE266]